MDIRTTGSSEISVSGNIKTIDDSTAFRNEVQRLYESGSSAITVRVEDSFAMPSAVIGYLMKLVNRDKVKLTVLAGDPRLVELLDELQLKELFGVRAISK